MKSRIKQLKEKIKAKEPIDLDFAASIAEEIDFYRSRLEIDHYYVFDKASDDSLGLIRVEDDDNLSVDKIDCLEVEIHHMNEVITKMQKFIEGNSEKLAMNHIEGLLDANRRNKFIIDEK